MSERGEVEVTTAASELPVSLSEIKAHLHISDEAHDDYLSALISVCTSHTEDWTNRKWMNQTVTWYVDKWDTVKDGHIELPVGKVTAINSVKYKNEAGTLTTWDSSEYETDLVSLPARLKVKPDYSWPSLESGTMNRVQIEMVVGYATASAVPKAVKQAIMLLGAHYFENREAVYAGGGPVQGVPMTVDYLLHPYRILFMR